MEKRDDVKEKDPCENPKTEMEAFQCFVSTYEDAAKERGMETTARGESPIPKP